MFQHQQNSPSTSNIVMFILLEHLRAFLPAVQVAPFILLHWLRPLPLGPLFAGRLASLSCRARLLRRSARARSASCQALHAGRFTTHRPFASACSATMACSLLCASTSRCCSTICSCCCRCHCVLHSSCTQGAGSTPAQGGFTTNNSTAAWRNEIRERKQPYVPVHTLPNRRKQCQNTCLAAAAHLTQQQCLTCAHARLKHLCPGQALQAREGKHI